MDSIENVYQAIELFNGQNAEQSAVAAKWLSEFQKSVYAWQTADTLLQQNRHYHSCYFGAQTIRQKILHDFRELPSETYASLKDSLIQHLKRVEVQNPDHYAVIVTQISLALADLYLQVPEWIGFIAEIVNMFATGNDGALNIMLSLLRVFPEELGGRHLKLGSNRREAVQQELAGNFDTLIQCLTQILASHQGSPMMIKKVIQCINPWINNPLNRTENFATSSLLHDMLRLLTATNFPSDIYEANCEALSNAVILCEDMKNHYKLASVLQEGIYSSAEVYTALVAAEDFDKCASLARLYVELAESFLTEIANNPGKGLGDLRTLDLVLLVVGHHDYSMAEMTFSVWYRLSEFVFQITDDDSFSWLLNNFKPYVERYILCLYRHCQLDIDYDGVQDEKDDFVEFRERASETIKDVSFILSSVSLIKSMVHLIETNQTGNWNEIESALFILSTVIGNVNESEETTVPTVLRIIENFPQTTHVALLNTAAQVLGSTADWFETHDEPMYRAFNWLISLSAKHELLKSSAESIESICKVSGDRLRMFFNQLVEFMHRVESCQTNGVRAEAAAQAILRSCATLLNDLSSNDIAKQLEDLCRDPIERLTQIAAAYGTELTDGNENARDSWARASTDPLIWIDRLTSIFKTLKPWNHQQAFKLECAKLNIIPEAFDNIPELQVPWLQLGGRVWDGILLILEAYQSNYRTVEHCCRCLRYLIRSMGAQSVMFVANLANLIMRVYESHPHSCFLYLASVIVDEYGLFGNILPDLFKMAEMIANRSFIIFQQPNGFQNHPDTIDDLFRLAFRFVQKVPEAFCTNSLARNFFECGIATLELDHVEAHRSVTKFFEETLKFVRMAKKAGNTHPAVLSIDHLFEEMGERIVWHSIHGSLFTLSPNLRKDVSEFLFEILEVYKTNFDTWLRSTIQRLVQERGSLGASLDQLEKFHADVTRMYKGGSVKQVASKLREHEDFNLALKLQEEEFNNHYDRNRVERKVMGVDTKKSKEEQEKLKRESMEKRLKEYSEIAKRDEQLAKRIQMEYEMEERRRQEEQARNDSEIARRLHMENGVNEEHYDTTPIPYEEDEVLARELQERYLRRLSNSRGMLDPTTQSELSYYVGRQVLSPPENLMPRRSSQGQPGIQATHFSPIEAIPPTTTVVDTSLLPPLPSYNEICSPSVTTSTINYVSAISTAAISPSTTNILTSAGNAAIPARAPLHPIVTNPHQTVTNSSIGANNVNNSTTSQTSFNPEHLHATNPFLQDVLLSQYNANNPSSSTASSNATSDDFGLPPFSDLYRATANASTIQESSARRIPQDAIPVIPNFDQNELRSRMGQN